MLTLIEFYCKAFSGSVSKLSHSEKEKGSFASPLKPPPAQILPQNQICVNNKTITVRLHFCYSRSVSRHVRLCVVLSAQVELVIADRIARQIQPIWSNSAKDGCRPKYSRKNADFKVQVKGGLHLRADPRPTAAGRADRVKICG
jgi:hypothetical protein